MFGILRPCARHSCPSVHRAWLAHLCGLCLTLRDHHGHLARTATNYDGLILSVLAEAQTPGGPERRAAGPCPLRGFQPAAVVPSRAAGARLAAVVSLALAAGKIHDHAADGDGVAGRRISGAPVRGLASVWTAAAERDARSIGFDAAVLTEAAGRQALLEAAPGVRLLALTEPTETAAAAAFAHTATLAGRPGNQETLREAGRHFGRIAHLLDAVEDLADDRARGAFNPLIATGTSLAEARRVCDRSLHGITLAVRDLDLTERHLVEALLRDETRRAVTRVFAAHGSASHGNGPHGCAVHSDGHEHTGRHTERHTEPEEPGTPPGHERPARPGRPLAVLAGGLTALTCGLYRPPWSDERHQPWHERCCVDHCDCCDCSSCCDGNLCDCGSCHHGCSGDCCSCDACCSGDCCSCDGCCCDCSCT